VTGVQTCALPILPRTIFTLIEKRGDAELAAAAALLGMPLVFLPRAALAAATPRLLTTSAAAQRRFGLPSVAEAAALAGAGASGRLLGPRKIGVGTTCAIAIDDLESAPS
jgi:cobalt-precorrin 5A hydrolase